MASSLTPPRRPRSARRCLTALVAAGGLVFVPHPAAAEPEPTTSRQAADLMADRARDLEILTEQFNEARERLRTTRTSAVRAEKELAAAEAGLAQARDRIRALARNAYTGEGLATLEVMLTSGSRDEMLDRVGTLQAIADHNGGVLVEATTATAGADRAKAKAERAAADAQALVDRVTAQKADLDEQIATYQAAYDRLNAAEQRASRAAAERRAAARPAAPRPARNGSHNAAATPAPAAPAVSVPAPAAGGSAAARTAVSTALAQVGDPYVWAAAGPDAFDCSGLMQYAYAAAGISLPHSSRMQSTMGTPVSRSALQPGDLLFFYSPVSHVGMYIGNGQMVHASTSGSPVKVAPVDYMPNYNSARRIVG
jgi:cell wall-associated NlpC family hydrolase